jgi:hypothetical protein
MDQNDDRVDQIVHDLLDRPLSKRQRVALLRELVRKGDQVPDELLQHALRKLMERLTE